MLIRTVGLKGAILMGMGSIVGTGVFVSLGLAAGITGASMILALLFAGFLATCNGLSTAQLAACHPVSGGTYEYGYRFSHPWLGYLAGWLFMAAKSASAATAAIGFGAYWTQVFGVQEIEAWEIGLIVTGMAVLVSALGLRRSNFANTVVVSMTLISLAIFVFFCFGSMEQENFFPFFQSLDEKNRSSAWPQVSSFLEATALMFVAYTGYGRIATLGEEIHDPKKNIPKAIIATLGLSFVVYLSVAMVGIGTVGAEKFYSATVNESAPLEVVAQALGHPMVAIVLSWGAMTALLGVLLNLILGLSRVVYAMGKREDLPPLFSQLHGGHRTPVMGVLTSGAVIVALIFLKDIRATWSFSAFTVLFYYAITNISALRLPKQNRLYPRPLAWMGLLGCISLGLFVDSEALQLGSSVLAVGVLWRLAYRWRKTSFLGN